jgi:hypothetical protein
MNYAREIEEPEKVVDNNKNTRRDEGERCQRYTWPRLREVLKIDNMAEYREQDPCRRKRICDTEQNV